MLDRARDENRTVPLAELQEEVGVGHGDLQETLSALRERGEAVEGAPGEWRRPFDDELADARPVSAASDRSGRDDLDAIEERVRVRNGQPPAPRPRVTSESGECVLTVGVAQALGAEALGKLAAAGIEEAVAEGRAFVLRVG